MVCRLMQEDVDIIFAEELQTEHQPKIEVARQYISGGVDSTQ